MTTTSTSTTAPGGTLTEAGLHAFAVAWYEALDRHDDLAAVCRYLVPDGLEMVFPEATAHGIDGFTEWYERVTRTFFDEVHQVVSTSVGPIRGDRAEVSVLVNWKASTWDPPAPHSARLDFDAGQTWVVVATGEGLRIARYVVDTFDPRPGSAAL